MFDLGIITKTVAITADNTYVFVVTDLAGNSTGATFTIDTAMPTFAGVVS